MATMEPRVTFGPVQIPATSAAVQAVTRWKESGLTLVELAERALIAYAQTWEYKKRIQEQEAK